jgi:thiosulfate/3-mercaptopyruvate sulfurtransferase
MFARCLLAFALIAGLPGLIAGQTRDLPMLVDAAWLAENLDVPELVVVNVARNSEGFEAGRIPGAIYLPLDRIIAEVDGVPSEVPPVERLIIILSDLGIHDDTYVVFYGEPLLAARAWVTMDYIGFGDRAAILDGGLEAWKAAGREVNTVASERRMGNFQLWPERHRFVEAEWVREQIANPRVVLIDARPTTEYTGQVAAGNGRYPAGRIPGAKGIFWQELLRSREDTRLLPIDELRARFEAVGAGPEKVVVTYCTTGMQASMLYFVSRLLGYETRMYDGSWHDWSARGFPVETD